MAGKGSKKVGRGARSPSRAAYKREGRREKNKKAAIARHVARNPNDLQAKTPQTNVDYKQVKHIKDKLKAHLANVRWQQYLKG